MDPTKNRTHTDMTEAIDEAVWWMDDLEYAIWLNEQLGE